MNKDPYSMIEIGLDGYIWYTKYRYYASSEDEVHFFFWYKWAVTLILYENSPKDQDTQNSTKPADSPHSISKSNHRYDLQQRPPSNLPVRFPVNIPNIDHISLTEGGPDISNKWMNLELPSTSLDPSNNRSRITLEANLFRMKLLVGKSDIGSGSIKLCTWDRRLNQVVATIRQKLSIMTMDYESCTASSIPNVAIKVHLDNP